MHNIEPYYNWRDYYISEKDKNSPFYKRKYNEFFFDKSIYNYLIHPQWDDFSSETLYVKILFADYDIGYSILEFIGEWNDCITNDIMLLKREVIDILLLKGINKFILIGENVLNFHFDIDDYYSEWYSELEDGWITFVNFRDFIIDDLIKYKLDRYIVLLEEFNELNWRQYKPSVLFDFVNELINIHYKGNHLIAD